MTKHLLLPISSSEPFGGGLRRLAWQAVGGSALLLGAVGAALPLLPTTPFVILASFAFARNSPALHGWLLRSRTFGPVITDWRANGAIAPQFKALALAMLGGTLTLSVVMAVAPAILAAQAVCMAAAAIFILSRPCRAA